MKSEPHEFSIDDLLLRKTATWDGVRNYQVRNMLRDVMKPGDQAFFYHSSCPVPGIAGVMKIASQPFPDASALDKSSPYFDAKATVVKNPWYAVQVQFLQKFDNFLPLTVLKSKANLAHLQILARGNRLSITHIAKNDFDLLLKMATHS